MKHREQPTTDDDDDVDDHTIPPANNSSQKDKKTRMFDTIICDYRVNNNVSTSASIGSV